MSKRKPPTTLPANASAADAYNAGVTAGEAGDLEAAELYFKRAAEMKPDYLDAYFNWGAVLLDLGHPDEAVPVFEKAIAVNQEFALAYFMLGTAFGMLGEPRRSFAATTRGMQYAPDDVQAQANAALAAFHLHAYADAAARYLLAVRAQEENLALLADLGAAVMNLTHAGKGELLDGGGDFELQNPYHVTQLALAFWALELEEEAQEQCDSVKALDARLGNKLEQIMSSQLGQREQILQLALKIEADPLYATDGMKG